MIQRTILENPGWYTQYTPYQAEIAQGRLEALATFQTMVCDLTGLPIANASLLDEATAAAEAVHLAHGHHRGKRSAIQISDDCHPQVIQLVHTRCKPLGIRVEVMPSEELAPSAEHACVITAYPGSSGVVAIPKHLPEQCQAHKTLLVVCSRLAGPVQPDAPRRMGCGHRLRLGPALWCAPRRWWPARGLLRPERTI